MVIAASHEISNATQIGNQVQEVRDSHPIIATEGSRIASSPFSLSQYMEMKDIHGRENPAVPLDCFHLGAAQRVFRLRVLQPHYEFIASTDTNFRVNGYIASFNGTPLTSIRSMSFVPTPAAASNCR